MLFLDRVGSCFRPLSIVCNDRNKKRLRFETKPKLVIKLIARGQILAEVRNKKVEITSDKFMMKIKVTFEGLLCIGSLISLLINL